MQDLATRSLKFGIDGGGVTQYYFEHPHDQLTRDLSDQWVPFSTLDEGTGPEHRHRTLLKVHPDAPWVSS